MVKKSNATFIDHRAQVLSQLNANCLAWQSAVGLAAVGYVMDMMRDGYTDRHPTRNIHGEIIGEHTAIRDTGDLMRDVNYEAAPDGRSVKVGNSLRYAVYVREGTSKLRGRPYIRDALEKHKRDLETLSGQTLSTAWTGR